MKAKIEQYISIWENRCYSNGIPDEVPNRIEHLNKAPSYKAICRCIMKNDSNLKGIGFTPNKSSAYNAIKRNELMNRDAFTNEVNLFNL